MYTVPDRKSIAAKKTINEQTTCNLVNSLYDLLCRTVEQDDAYYRSTFKITLLLRTRINAVFYLIQADNNNLQNVADIGKAVLITVE